MKCVSHTERMRFILGVNTFRSLLERVLVLVQKHFTRGANVFESSSKRVLILEWVFECVA